MRTVAPQEKYGLIKKYSKKFPNMSQLRGKKILNLFDEGDEDDLEESASQKATDRVNRELSEKSRAAEQEFNRLTAKLTAEEQSIFDYDASYETFKTQERKSHPLCGSTTDKAPVS